VRPVTGRRHPPAAGDRRPPDALTDEQAIAAIEQLARTTRRTGASVSSRGRLGRTRLVAFNLHVYLQTPRWSAKQEHVLRDRRAKEQRGPAIRDAGAAALTDEHQQLVEVWDQARTKRSLETRSIPVPRTSSPYWDACQAAADKAARKAKGEWSPSAFEIARGESTNYLRETQPMAGGVQDQDYPFALLATPGHERLNGYRLPRGPGARGRRWAPPIPADPSAARPGVETPHAHPDPDQLAARSSLKGCSEAHRRLTEEPHEAWPISLGPKVRQIPIVNGASPPHDLDAEAAVLSALLLSRDALDTCSRSSSPSISTQRRNGRIYEGALALAVAGSVVDIVTVASYLRDAKRSPGSGAASYLAQLADCTPAVSHVAAQRTPSTRMAPAARDRHVPARGRRGLRRRRARCRRSRRRPNRRFYTIAHDPRGRRADPWETFARSVAERSLAGTSAATTFTGDATHYRKLDEMMTGMDPPT